MKTKDFFTSALLTFSLMAAVVITQMTMAASMVITAI